MTLKDVNSVKIVWLLKNGSFEILMFYGHNKILNKTAKTARRIPETTQIFYLKTFILYSCLKEKDSSTDIIAIR